MKRMTIVDKFSKSIWKREEKKFEALEKKVKIPNRKLHEVDFVILKKEEDFEKIPQSGGCYWLWTNEPVHHQLHKNPIPEKIKKGEVIYNGIAKDNVRQRVKHHLWGEMNAGWSGISLDIYPKKSPSHRKKAMSPKGKVPYVDSIIDKRHEINKDSLKPIRTKDLIFRLYLSRAEKTYIKDHNQKTYFFRNGIKISDPKHKNFKFKVYFITGSNWLYLEYIEKKWREEYGLPKLCTYSSGR